MAASYTLALVGFAPREADTLDAFFRLAARRPPAYRVQDLALDAHLLLVNADNPQALQQVRHAGWPGQVLLMGSHDGGTGWPLQRKPVKLVALLHELDRLVGSGRLAADFAPTRLQPRTATPPTAAQRAAQPGVLRLTEFASLDDLQPMGSSPGAAGGLSPLQRGDALLVSDSLEEGRALHQRLTRYGLRIDWSREGEQALTLLQAHAYRLVAVDRLNGEPDAYQVCRAAKQTRQANGQPPVVVLFAPGGGSMDRIRAGLAGCDAFLPRAVGEADLYKLLAQHRLVSLDGFAKTDVGI